MVKRRRVQKWLSLVLPLLLAGFLLVGCDAGEQEGGGGGLGDETPVVDDGLGTGVDDGLDDGVDDGLDDGMDEGLDETPMIEPTVPIDAAPTEEATVAPELEEEPTVEVEPTAEVAATAEMTATAETDGQTMDPDAQGQGMVVLASDLLGMNIQESAGTDIAVVDEILVDESGAIQYVIVNALAVDATTDVDVTDDAGDDALTDDDTTDDATTDDATTDDALTDDTVQDDSIAGNNFALAWNAIEVQAGVMPETEPDVTVDDEMFHLLYAGDATLQDEMAFDMAILDEEGAILDDQATTDTEVTVPSEFVNLLQISEYNEMDLTNNEGEDIGEIEDALIDLQEGNVVYVIVDVGGFLGIGETSVAIPFNAFQVDVNVAEDAEEESIMLDANQERLENAPEFNYDDWTPNVNTDWDAEWNEFWQDLETSVDS